MKIRYLLMNMKYFMNLPVRNTSREPPFIAGDKSKMGISSLPNLSDSLFLMYSRMGRMGREQENPDDENIRFNREKERVLEILGKEEL